jgi:alpha-1,6-mannosyltransferase
VRAVALVMLTVVVLSPVVHHWYLLWCVPLLAVCHLGPRASAALLHVSWLLALVAPLDSSLEGAGTVIVMAVLLVGAVALLVVHGHRSAQRRATEPQASERGESAESWSRRRAAV